MLVDKKNFPSIANRIMNIDGPTLENLISRLSHGSVKPETEEEKACFKLLSDLDYVNYQVKGSMTNKKYLRNEIWSLVSYMGAPSWFITFAPTDVKHLLALYYADTKQDYTPEFRKHCGGWEEYNETRLQL